MPAFYFLAGGLALFVAVFLAWREEHRLLAEERRKMMDWNDSERIQARRRAIYDLVGRAFGRIIRDAHPGNDGLHELHEARAESALYAADVEPFIKDCIRHAAALETARSLLDRPDIGNPNIDRKPWIEKTSAAIEFFGRESTDLEKRFRPLIGEK